MRYMAFVKMAERAKKSLVGADFDLPGRSAARRRPGDTDWGRIAALYDALGTITPAPSWR